MKPKRQHRTPSVHLLTRLVLTGLLGAAILLAVFVFLGLSALQESTNRALAERLVLARQTAANLDFALQDSLNLIEGSMKTKPLDLQSERIESVRLAFRETYSTSLITPYAVSLIALDGRVFLTEPSTAEPLLAQGAASAQVYEMVRLGKAVISSSADVAPGRPMVYFTVPVWAANGGMTAAVQMAIDLTQSNLASFIQTPKTRGSSYVEIIDSKGMVLASTDALSVFTQGDHGNQFALLINQGKATAGTCHRCHATPNGPATEREALAFAPLSQASWGVAIREPEAEVLAPTRWLEIRLILLGVASLLTVASVGWLFARSMLPPLVHLGKAASQIGAGNLDKPVSYIGHREFAELSSALEDMRVKLKESHEELQRWNRDLDEKMQERTKQLSALVQASQTLVSNLDSGNVFNVILRTAVNTFGSADGGILFLYDKETERLVSVASVGYDTSIPSRARLKRGEAIAAEVFRWRQPLLSNDPEEAAEALEGASLENRLQLGRVRQGREIQRFISVPLQIAGQALGSLTLVGLREGLTFSQLDLQLVTAFANVAAALLQKTKLLEEAGRAEALRKADELKTVFLSNVSHELQTPLASIRASLDFVLAADLRGLNEAQIRLLHNAVRSGERLSRLINDLMDIARLESGRLTLNWQRLDLREVIYSVSDAFKPMIASKRQRFELYLPSVPLAVTGDERRLEQILNNLVSNAHLYTPSDGTIRVRAYEQECLIVIGVTDTGPGIPADKQALVFQRFYSDRGGGSDSRKGLGLGLSIARGLAELHGGKLWLESELGKGSTFWFSLPRGDDGKDTDLRR